MTSETFILIVDDEPDILENIKLALEVEGYHVLSADDGVAALKILQSHHVNLIMADIAMPNMNGYQLFEQVRQNPDWVTVPFMFLSARTMDSDIRYGKELGVDDYLTKPIRVADLLAAVRGKLRRAEQLERLRTPKEAGVGNGKILEVGGLCVDSNQHRVWLNDREVQLSAKEFSLLTCLAKQAGNVLSPSELVKYTHGYETDHIEAGSLLRPIILSLRRKLDLTSGEVGSIENVRGVGYRLVAVA
jgi:two-component system alkaline phosphatase synthesis response regulator PhoP